MDEKSGKQVAAESGDAQQEPGESRSGLASGIGLSSPSAGALRQPTSRPRSRLQREQDELEDYVEDLIERRLQAAKDKRLRRLEEEIQELSERVGRNEAHLEPPAPAAAMERPAAAGRPAARASHLSSLRAAACRSRRTCARTTNGAWVRCAPATWPGCLRSSASSGNEDWKSID